MGLTDLKILRAEFLAKKRAGEHITAGALELLQKRIEEIESGRVDETLMKSHTNWTIEQLEALVKEEPEQRINPNVQRAAGDVFFKNARQAQASLTNDKHNHIDLAVGASSIFIKGETDKDRPFNSYAGMTGAGSTLLTGEALVKARAECSRHCKMQGRTSCRYCMGEGFTAKSARENNPSRNINKARHETSQLNGTTVLRKV